MEYQARDLGPAQLTILADKAEQNDGTTRHDLRPDKTTVHTDRWELHVYFSERRAVIQTRCREVLHPHDIFPQRYCSVWEYREEIRPA